MPAAPSPPSEHLVTSSDLVRHFGLWQERAARAPLYILHRGRPRFVLTSIETMEALCAPYALAADGARDSTDPDMLLDMIADLVLIADADGAIVASSRAARAHFGALAGTGMPVDGLVAVTVRPFLADAIRRVIATGAGDRVELPSARREGRMLALAIEPAGAGVALVAQDETTARENARALALEQAAATAMREVGGVAVAQLNTRGYLADPAPALSALTGLPAETLATLRFVALAEIGARAALGLAIEAALAGDTPPALAASLLVNRADPVAVRIALAPVRGSGGVAGVVAVIVAA